ncbi:endothelin-converting enzyme 2-like isoform X1 [Lampetra fluviatilis]
MKSLGRLLSRRLSARDDEEELSELTVNGRLGAVSSLVDDGAFRGDPFKGGPIDVQPGYGGLESSPRVASRSPPSPAAPSAATRLGVPAGRLSRRERSLLLLLALALLGLVIAGLGWGLSERRARHTGVCLSERCVRVAAGVLASMDRSVEPCQDFYGFACGRWERLNPLPDGHSRWTTFSSVWRQNQATLKHLLELPEDAAGRELGDAQGKARRYFRACMDEQSIEQRGAAPLQQLLTQLGGWSMLGTWNETGHSLQELLEVVMGSYRASPFFAIYVGQDAKHSNSNIVQIDQSGLGLPSRDYYINLTANEKVLAAYEGYMVRVAVLLGAEEAAASAAARSVLRLEEELALITVPMEERRDDEKIYHRMALTELQELAPTLRWDRLVGRVLEPVALAAAEPLVVYAPTYLQNAAALINRTDTSVLNAYVLWSLVSKLTLSLGRSFRQAREELLEALLGAKASCTPRWQTCVEDTDSTLGFALGAMFIHSSFDNSSKSNAQQMIAEIREAFTHNLDSLQWMDPETRVAAKQKANAIHDMIGFPDFLNNQTELDGVYTGYKVSEDDYFANVLSFFNFSARTMAKQLRKTPERDTWSMTPPTVNAYYGLSRNVIVFPAGILQPPFYSSDFPKALNFGGIGMVMGHELTHAFDDQGREYDAEGNLRSWWGNESLTAFHSHTACMERQYSSFAVAGEHVDGRRTLGENIADNGGLKSAYHAYESWVSSHGEEDLLPGVGLTNSQLFFVGFAQMWCAVRTAESAHEGLLADPHSPSHLRVAGSVSNSEEFARHFSCAPGTPMNPADRCSVW